MKKARSIYTGRLRMRMLLCIWCVLAAIIPVALSVERQLVQEGLGRQALQVGRQQC